jgi:hypothetical protein
MAIRVSIVQSNAVATSKPGWNDYEFQQIERNFLTKGIIQGSYANDFRVTERGAGANMSLDVAAGRALIAITNTNVTHGKTYKVYFDSDSVVNVPVTTADATNPRKDRLILRVSVAANPNTASSNIGTIELLAGTPAVSPSAPEEPSNALTLAVIDVPAGDTAITNSQITDSRTYSLLNSGVLLNVTRQGFSNTVADGSGTDTVTASYSPAITALSDRMILAFVPANDNTGAATFNPDGFGAKEIRKRGNSALEASDLKAKVCAFLQYNLADDNWKLLNPQTTAYGSKSIFLSPQLASISASFGCAAPATYTPATTIAFDEVTAGNSGSGSSHTIAHTTSGSNRYLLVGFKTNSESNTAIGVTYNGVAMTQIGKSNNLPLSESVYLYGLVAPASGNHNVVISLSEPAAILYSIASYTGVQQTAQPPTATISTQTSGTSLTNTPTTVSGNDWVVAFARNNQSNFTPGANTTARGAATSAQIFDSNAPGVYTLNFSWSGTGGAAAIGIVLKPTSSSPAVRVLDFDQSFFEQAEFQVIMPDNYTGGTFTAVFHWLSTAGSGNVVWRIEAMGLPNNTSLTSAAIYGTAQSVTSGSNGANKLNVSAATAPIIPGGTPGANTPMWFRVSRDATNASDTLAADARLVGVQITF